MHKLELNFAWILFGQEEKHNSHSWLWPSTVPTYNNTLVTVQLLKGRGAAFGHDGRTDGHLNESQPWRGGGQRDVRGSESIWKIC